MSIGTLVAKLILKCQEEDIKIECDKTGCAILVGDKGIWVDKDWLYREERAVSEDIDNLFWATQHKRSE